MRIKWRVVRELDLQDFNLKFKPQLCCKSEIESNSEAQGEDGGGGVFLLLHKRNYAYRQRQGLMIFSLSCYNARLY